MPEPSIQSPRAQEKVEELINNCLPEPFLYPSGEGERIGNAMLQEIEAIVELELAYRTNGEDEEDRETIKRREQEAWDRREAAILERLDDSDFKATWEKEAEKRHPHA